MSSIIKGKEHDSVESDGRNGTFLPHLFFIIPVEKYLPRREINKPEVRGNKSWQDDKSESEPDSAVLTLFNLQYVSLEKTNFRAPKYSFS